MVSSQSHGRGVRLALFASAVLAYSLSGQADDSAVRGFSLRNHNPFLQIYGLPAFRSAGVVEAGRLDYQISLDLANNADAGDNSTENVVIDGESYFLTLSLRRRVTDRLELALDLPYVAHSDGFMDDMIVSWHDTFGLSNSKRNGPENQLRFLYARNGQTLYELTSPESGLGDIRVSAAIPIRESDGTDTAITIRTSLKLPTGDADELLGSGGTDLALGLNLADTRQLMERSLGLAGFVGVMFLGEGDILPALQRDTVTYGGVSATWQATERFALAAQLHAQTAYFDSDIEELGGNTLQLAVGADYRTRGNGTLLRLAVVEDVSANATTDFALHFSVFAGGG